MNDKLVNCNTVPSYVAQNINYEEEYRRLCSENQDIRKTNEMLRIEKAELERAILKIILKL